MQISPGRQAKREGGFGTYSAGARRDRCSRKKCRDRRKASGNGGWGGCGGGGGEFVGKKDPAPSETMGERRGGGGNNFYQLGSEHARPWGCGGSGKTVTYEKKRQGLSRLRTEKAITLLYSSDSSGQEEKMEKGGKGGLLGWRNAKFKSRLDEAKNG